MNDIENEPDDGILELGQETAEVRLTDLLRAWYRTYIDRHSERALVIVILAAVIVIGYFVESKLAFLNFFYIPILFAACAINSRTAVLGALFSVLVVSLYALTFPDQFLLDTERGQLLSHIITWGSFLILSGALVGRLNEKQNERYNRSKKLVEQLKKEQIEVDTSHKKLQKGNESLQLKSRTIESLKEKLEAVLYSAMDPEVVRLAVNRQIVTEKKLMTILFTDLQGFTQYSEARSPDVVIEGLNQYFNAMEPIISRYRGHLDKFIGDGIMAEFGAPLHFQQHAAMAVLAAIRMQTRAKKERLLLPMRIGIATGGAIMGLVGSEKRKTYSAFGDTVNLAQRLEMMCTPGKLLINEETWNNVSHFVRTRKIRMGLSNEKVLEMEDRLDKLQDIMTSGSGGGEVWLEAGRIATQLGECNRAVQYLKDALRLLPQRKIEIDESIVQAVMVEEERSQLEVKGRIRKVTAYEVLALSDPLQDINKFPPTFHKRYGSQEPKLNGVSEYLLAIEAVDASIGQSRVTTSLSRAIAEAMGVTAQTRETASIAGYLHHVGKRFIPENLLNREDAEHNLQVMTGHVNEAEKVIAELGVEVSSDVLEAIRHHHEKFMGGGYPDGLKGDAIPLPARIIQVASQYDTLTAWKPYRDAWNRKAALSELHQQTEHGHFDPKVIAALTKVLEAS